MPLRSLTLERLPGRYAIIRLPPDAPIPAWAEAKAAPRVTSESHTSVAIERTRREDAAARVEDAAARKSKDATGRLLSITHTDRELSIVIDQSLVPAEAAEGEPPADMRIERDFAALRIAETKM